MTGHRGVNQRLRCRAILATYHGFSVKFSQGNDLLVGEAMIVGRDEKPPVGPERDGVDVRMVGD